ncbi:monooxygenase [N-oxide-forming] 3 [Seminavis robusta]|uniref:Monooxygenase [N-oxide-forming] 3 n=1 Tax=Seminavis robusta TaxID=568900 RepID=A0A9N8HLN7_9STRA|nr:monooxygenase [N-oxide-forming] 3 [Seminavis robusta]|eukprot:Sro694_g188570.1 monooxygenase [N-oxide-forming] 3 (579) ;mRNA; r:47409-49246
MDNTSVTKAASNSGEMGRRYSRGRKKPKVAIIGAGVAGCAMAAALKDQRIDFVVYDKNSKPGGLWADNYPGAKVQSTFELYEYPCKKFPEHIRNRKNPPSPTADEVCTYLKEFIEEKGMKHKFKYNTKIDDIRPVSEGEWTIEFESGKMKSFSYVIICTGIVSVKPRMIDIPGAKDFEWNGGEVIHSSQRKGETFHYEDQKVLIIGNGKSAVDAATSAALIAKEHGTKPPIQVARRAAWYVPRFILGSFQYKWVFHTRLGSSLLPRYHETTNWILIFLHLLFAPLKWFLWRIVELLLLIQYWLPWRLQPRLGTILRGALDVSVLITDEEHLHRLRSGEIDMRIATVERLTPDGKAILSNGDEEQVDTVIQATGWKLGFDTYMDTGSLIRELDIQEDGLWLYHNILPPKIKGIAFVGSNTLTFMNIYTSYIQAYWLAGLLAGDRPWPKRDHMIEKVEQDKAFKRRLYPNHVMRAASIEAYMQHYHDVLFKEMNARKPFTNCLIRPFADLVVPVTPELMKGTLEPTRESRRENHMKRKQRKSLENEDTSTTKEGARSGFLANLSEELEPPPRATVPVELA